MHCARFFVVFFLIAINLSTIVNADKAESVGVPGSLSSLDLYGDIVVTLNANSLASTIFGSNKSWVVGYANEHGMIARDFVADWIKVGCRLRLLSDVSLAVIYCTVPFNTKACNEQNIKTYPTIQYYPPNSENDSFGINIEYKGDDTKIATDIIQLMRENEKTVTEANDPNIQHLTSSEDRNLSHDEDGGKMSKKETDWESPSTTVIYTFIGLLVLMMVLWSSYTIIKRLAKTEVNVYSILHKSEGNDGDSIQLRLKK